MLQGVRQRLAGAGGAEVHGVAATENRREGGPLHLVLEVAKQLSHVKHVVKILVCFNVVHAVGIPQTA